MRLDPAAFDRFISGIGQDLLWRRAYACPCINPHSGAPLSTCSHCLGSGRLWQSPVDVRLGVSGQDAQKTWANFGLYEAGDQVVIVPSDSPAYGLGPYDRFLSMNRTEPFSANFTRGVNEEIRFPVASIDRVLYLDGASLVDAAIPGISSSGMLDWGVGGPPVQTTYSVTGRRRSEWFVFRDMPFDRPHHAGQTLPRRVVLRRFDTYSRGAGTVPPVGPDTRPRFGVGAADAGVASPAALIAAMVPIPGAVRGSRAGAFTLTTAPGLYGWVAVLASATTDGLSFLDGAGSGGWSGAGLAGDNAGATDSLSVSAVLFTDEAGVAWRLFRQDYGNANSTPATYNIL